MEHNNVMPVSESSSKGTMSKIFGDISMKSVTIQTCYGLATGSVAGYVFGRVGRTAAAGVGVSVLLIQVAQHKGYIRINWKSVQDDINTTTETITDSATTSAMSKYAKETMKFVQGNLFLAAGFGSGFLIGLSL